MVNRKDDVKGMSREQEKEVRDQRSEVRHQQEIKGRLSAAFRLAVVTCKVRRQKAKSKAGSAKGGRIYAASFAYLITGTVIVLRLDTRLRFPIRFASCRPTSALTTRSPH